MNILPITNLQFNNNYRQGIHRTQKNTPIMSATNPTFCGYKEVLKDSFNKALNNKWDLGVLYQELFDSATSIPGATLTEKGKFFLIDELFSSERNFLNMSLALGGTRFKGLGEIYGLDILLQANDYPIITRCRKTIEFSHPEVNGSIEFWMGEDSMDLYIKRPGLKQGFYNDDRGLLKEETIYTDWCTPTTTYYNKDGSEKKLKSFFGSMGF